MPLFEVVKADGTREQVEADFFLMRDDGRLEFYKDVKFTKMPSGTIMKSQDPPIKSYAPGTWLEVKECGNP